MRAGPAQNRHGGGVGVAEKGREAVKQQIRYAWFPRFRSGTRRFRYLSRAGARSGQRPRVDGRRQCLQVRFAGQLRIDHAEPLGRFEQQCRGLAAARREERNPAPQQLGRGPLRLTKNLCLSQGDQA